MDSEERAQQAINQAVEKAKRRVAAARHQERVFFYHYCINFVVIFTLFLLG